MKHRSAFVIFTCIQGAARRRHVNARDSQDYFILQGLKDFLSGKSKKDAKECMISTYKNTIKDMPSNSFEDNFQKMLMINNLESLVFEGEDDLLFSDLA